LLILFGVLNDSAFYFIFFTYHLLSTASVRFVSPAEQIIWELFYQVPQPEKRVYNKMIAMSKGKLSVSLLRERNPAFSRNPELHLL